MNSTDASDASQYLKFKLAQETYALEVKRLREVMGFSEITKVPRMPEFIRGVINLRGEIVPVADLRLKFGMTITEKTADTCIIIIELDIGDEMTLLGALADSVQEVIILEPSQILPPPKIGARLDTAFLKGMGKTNDELVMIVNIDKIFSLDDVPMLQYPQEEMILNEEGCQDMNEDIEGEKIK